jgi:hypothetical protein
LSFLQLLAVAHCIHRNGAHSVIEITFLEILHANITQIIFLALKKVARDQDLDNGAGAINAALPN